MDKNINCSNGGNLGNLKDLCGFLSRSATPLLELQFAAKLPPSLSGQTRENEENE